ncbi:MAG: long-chain fatty acid--CoA ligase [Rhodospirillaceae bacterium]|nr:long-chain fatty acid--CoA ligase [Rhodospirillaceae bacterium]MYH36644.1 long-chain fatty acid--CoA ligase [Rhodospirillaceae bacterium]MYK13450.1 long-chain fatty acid--CoA ligase [Rhodospirillaceae bacterium]
MDGPTGTTTPESIVFDGCDTLPGLFRKRYTEQAARVAMREKDLGIWRSISWADYGEAARNAGQGLMAMGLARGDVVSILSETNKEWMFADLGAICAGASSSGVYTTDSAKQLEYIVNDSSSAFLFVENEEQLDKYLQVRDRVPTLRKVIIMDLEGLRDFDDPMTMSWDELLELGRQFGRDNPAAWDERIDGSAPDDAPILVYTSGTTGPPKGAMISNRNVIFQVSNANAMLHFREGDNQLAFLPLCHIAERGFSMFLSIAYKTVVNFAESPETVAENVREVAPHYLFAVPRVWEKFYSTFTIRMQDATWTGKRLYDWAIGVGMRMAEHRIEGTAPGVRDRLLYAIAGFLVLNNVKTMIGLRRTRWTATGAAPISPDLIRWYLALGINMVELYGQTENTGVATSNRPDEFKVGTVGLALPNTEVKISERGEILIKGPHVFKGYLNNPEKTAETVVDGWLHTGDVGSVDNQGYFRITDRIKDIIITAGGKNVTPSEIENQLKFSPYIADAVIVGDQRKFLSCLVMIDEDTVMKFAQDNNVPFSNYASLCRADAVQRLIQAEIDAVNRDFARVEQVKAFRLIEQVLMPEDDELTPTMKLKRSFVSAKYKDLIDSMYEAA